jgi:hypothetical protein
MTNEDKLEEDYDNEDPDWAGLEDEAAENDLWNDEEQKSRNNIR